MGALKDALAHDDPDLPSATPDDTRLGLPMSLPEMAALAARTHAEATEDARLKNEDALGRRTYELLSRLLRPGYVALPDEVQARIRLEGPYVILDGVHLTVEHIADDKLRARVACGRRDNSGHVPTHLVAFSRLHELHDILLGADKALNKAVDY